MSRTVVTADISDSVAEIAARMAGARVSSVIVTERGGPVGIVTERDVAGYLRVAMSPLTPIVGTLGKSPLITVTETTDIGSAYRLLREHRIRHLVVASADGALVGVLSASDIRTWMSAETLHKLSDPRRLIDRDIPALDEHSSLGEVLDAMEASGRSFVIAVCDQRPVGTLTERDLPGLLTGSADTATVRLASVMHRELVTTGIDTPLDRVSQIMTENRIRHLPVVEPDGTLLGVYDQDRILEQLGVALLERSIQEQESLIHTQDLLARRWQMVMEEEQLGSWVYRYHGDEVDLDGHMLRLLGMDKPPRSLVGWLRRVHRRDRGQLIESIRCCRSGHCERLKTDLRIRMPDGGWKWFTLRGIVTERRDDGSPSTLEGIVWDVTVPRSREQALLESRNRLTRAEAVAQLGNWELDLATDRLLWSDQCYRIFGLDRDAFVPSLESFLARIHPDDRQSVENAYERAVRTRTPYRIVHRLILPDGSERTVREVAETEYDERGTPLRSIGTVLDITEQVAAELKLKEREEYFAAIVEQAADSIALVDLSSGRFVEFNTAAHENLRYSREEFAGLSVSDIDAEDDEEEVKKRFGEILKNESAVFETRHRTRDGEIRDVRVSARVVRVSGKTYLSSTWSDITELKQAARAADERDRAEAANQAKTAFLSSMSHEIRTPLAAIVSLSHLLRKDTPSPRQQMWLDKIDTSVDHLMSIINNILDISKIEANRLSLDSITFSLSETLEQVRTLTAARLAGRDIALTVEPGNSPEWLRGDPFRIRQALLNYAANAVKFTRQGAIAIRCRTVQEDADRIVLKFEVEDTGVGISDQDQQRLFTPFEQLNQDQSRRTQGTGLGLSITRHLAHLMGGDAGVNSTPGVGSVFWFTATLGRGVEPRAAVAHQEFLSDLDVIRERHRGRRVLIAEDNEIIRELTLELLEDSALVATTVENGAEAIEESMKHPYDLVLMDVQMPVVDGLEATQRLRQTPGYEDVPIIAMTASAFEEDRRRCQAAGMSDFVFKPVDPDTLFAVLLRWLDHAAERSSPGEIR